MSIQKEKEFLVLVEKHKGIIHKISKMYMDNSDDQKDLFQEIVLQLWKSYDSFNKQSQFSTWMYRVALNTAILYFKKDKRKPDTAFENIPDTIANIDDDAETKEIQLAHFYKALQKLDKIEKALVFYHLENYSHKEIGDNLGISEGNARVKLNRAKNRLKELIKEQGYEF
ncbi:RNA polymerase sigma factor [Solitalea canadensis]|uniref:RNA polymerase sigma factor, sigma-70 family n=1 Tax=Solitalea canadensis (strain ATCC 29591 / DSM 3403 / JCM 21819 / LMG 8368 / NBRC 15130 / NCIMB 12057 / USAM 9D) TaxID=929556 RepID=H8KX07_SOLCM|nr:sigma-70 family RNA polymerase sigma factor [Solitalea canadensis]AFD08336.1 RNA polymerase sigma factor, sigma-70 family [Solitalea canadensis DSM 3403]